MDQATTTSPAAILESDKLDLQELDALRRAALSSEQVWRELREIARKLAAGRPPASLAKRAKRAFALLALGRASAAVREIEDAKGVLEEPAAAAILGRALLEAGEPARALEVFESALKKAKGDLALQLGAIEARRRSGDAAGALDAARALEKKQGDRAAVLFQVGAALEQLGEYEGAMDKYEEALERDPEHVETLFRLAYNHELRGAPEVAMEYYRRCAAAAPLHPNALVNLGLLLEDRGRYSEAIECYQRVLAVRPGHARARMFLKDAEASLEMYYDEDQEKRSDRRNAILRIPVTDFELSVRARNCLNKMNIRNLGDLVTKTEEELLAYKNFGETSLQEIKQMLAQKGLRLGMFRENPAAVASAGAGGPGAPADEPRRAQDEILKKPIGELELSVRSKNCMERLNIRTIGDLVQRSEQDLLSVKNFGQTSLSEIKQKLADLGLSLRVESAGEEESAGRGAAPARRSPFAISAEEYAGDLGGGDGDADADSD